jgi:protein involved in polysaccharide export with SLBB domain
LLLALVAAALSCLSGCAGSGGDAVVDVDDYVRTTGGSDAYLLRVGDELEISFPAAPRLAYKTPVSPAGTVSVPSGGEVMVVGKTIDEARAAIEERMASLLLDPGALVTLSELGEQAVYVLGEVNKPGAVRTTGSISVAMALAEAGGLLSTGKPSSVMVVRTTGVEEAVAIKVDVSKVLTGRDLSNDLPLVANDVVYVPKSVIGQVDEFVDLFFNRIAPAQLFYLRGYDIAKNKPLKVYQ